MTKLSFDCLLSVCLMGKLPQNTRNYRVSEILMWSSVWKGFDGVVMKFVLFSECTDTGQINWNQNLSDLHYFQNDVRKTGSNVQQNYRNLVSNVFVVKLCSGVIKNMCKPASALNSLNIQSQQCCYRPNLRSNQLIFGNKPQLVWKRNRWRMNR